MSRSAEFDRAAPSHASTAARAFLDSEPGVVEHRTTMARQMRQYNWIVQHGTLKLVEECSGIGRVLEGDAVVGQVEYAIRRYQGMLVGSGMPVPGLYRVDGHIRPHLADRHPRLVGAPLTLCLEDGRTLPITLADAEGRIATEGHGPGRGCSCC